MNTALTPLAGQDREILSGRSDGASGIARRIAEPRGPQGGSHPGDPIWTVHGWVTTFLGGIRSLQFQALHPLAVAGVDQHSTFIAATTYGSTEVEEATVGAIQVMHRRVSGRASDGAEYWEHDPRRARPVGVHLIAANIRLR